MLPLASASGPAIISVVVVCAALFLHWLLRMEQGDIAAESSDDERDRDS
jgi:hypothetical protein